MNLENEAQSSLRSQMGSSAPVSDQMKPRIRYSREFFLSLRELDVCKKLPSGLDKSILSDLEDAANTASERQRNYGNLSLQGSRRGEYGSQLVNKPENSSSFTKGIASRWDTRSSGSSDKELDLQPDRESFTQDSGRRFGNQNRRTWQDPERDGLLGSGSLARPPGFAGATALKSHGNGQYLLSRSTEPYQPPRAYKAAPYSRKDGSDLCNDETFGSSECSNVDRDEEERKRRESFELMRKEQQKSLQEKRNNDIHKGNLDVDIMSLLENSDADKSTKSRGKPDESSADSLFPCDSSKSSSHIQVPAARPLVPPGFASTLVENQSQTNKLKGMALQSAEEKENPSAPPSVVPDVGFSNISPNTSVLQVVDEVWEDMPRDSFHKLEAVPDRLDAASQDHSKSIFDELFGNALAKKSGSFASDLQKNINKADEEAWTQVKSESSKFAHLFHEESEDKIPFEDKSSRDLLSVVVSNDNFSSEVYVSSNDETTEMNQSRLPSENAAVFFSSPAPSPITGLFLESYQGNDQRPRPVLTCEDLEQSILAEVKDRCCVMQSLPEPLTAVDDKSEECNGVVDDHASHHLLSLLQRGANSKESLESLRLDAIGSHDMLASSDIESSLHFQHGDNAGISLSETEHSSEKRLTLEALFGAAFMNELHSMEAPVSAQKSSVGRVNDSGSVQSHVLPCYPPDSLALIPNEQHSKKFAFEGEILQLNSSDHTRTHNGTENWAGYRGSSLHGFKLGDLAFEQAAGDIRLPEEDSLISLNDSLDAVASDSLCYQKVNRNESLAPEKMVGDLSDKLLHTILRVGEPSREPAVDYAALMQTSYEKDDPGGGSFHNLLVRPTLQLPHQTNQGRPLFAAYSNPPTHRTSQMNFVGPDVMLHDPHHPFAPNAFAHHNYNSSSGQLHFDPTTRHQMLQPMPFPGNFPSHNSVQGLPRVPHPINRIPGFSHEMNNLHMFPQNHRQPNYGGRGLEIPGHDGGVTAAGKPSHEAFERLLEMEMRANGKQFHPSIAENVHGMYGADLDMNLRYL